MSDLTTAAPVHPTSCPRLIQSSPTRAQQLHPSSLRREHRHNHVLEVSAEFVDVGPGDEDNADDDMGLESTGRLVIDEELVGQDSNNNNHNNHSPQDDDDQKHCSEGAIGFSLHHKQNSHSLEDRFKKFIEQQHQQSQDQSAKGGDQDEDYLEEDLNITASASVASNGNNNRRPEVDANNRSSGSTSHWLKDWVVPGKDVLARWKDGLFYKGVVVKVDPLTSRHVYIRFEDDSCCWTKVEDLHTQVAIKDVMSDILCSICQDGTSEEENEIVLCDVCNQGYHQKCHKPGIPDSVLQPNVPWSCRLCVFALGTREGGAEKLRSKIGKELADAKSCLPYELSSLVWDHEHQMNQQNTYCYCGGPGEYHSKMLQCQKCHQWFHEACIQVLDAPLLYGDHYWTFSCQICNKGRESVKRIIMKWPDVVSLILHNLMRKKDKKLFDLDSEIVPFLQTNASLIKLSENVSKLTKEEVTDKVLVTLQHNAHKFVQSMSKADAAVRSKKSSNSSRSSSSNNISPLWGLQPDHPLIFAPPNSITSSGSLFLAGTSSSSGAGAAGELTPSMIFPYGACRKGASVVPKSKPALVSSLTHHPQAEINLNSRRNEASSCVSRKRLQADCNPNPQSSSSSSAKKQRSADLHPDPHLTIRSVSSHSASSSSAVSSSSSTSSSTRSFPQTHQLMISGQSNGISMNSNANNKKLSSGNTGAKRQVKSATASSAAGPVGRTVIVHDSLESIFPYPDNFDGLNNPFLLDHEKRGRAKATKFLPAVSPVQSKVVNSTTNSSAVATASCSSASTSSPPAKKSNSPGEEYRVLKSSSPSKLTIQRIPTSTSPDSSPLRHPQRLSPTLLDRLTATATLESHHHPLTGGDGNDGAVVRHKKKYCVIARRVTSDGKIELLLEEDDMSSVSASSV